MPTDIPQTPNIDDKEEITSGGLTLSAISYRTLMATRAIIIHGYTIERNRDLVERPVQLDSMNEDEQEICLLTQYHCEQNSNKF